MPTADQVFRTAIKGRRAVLVRLTRDIAADPEAARGAAKAWLLAPVFDAGKPVFPAGSGVVAVTLFSEADGGELTYTAG